MTRKITPFLAAIVLAQALPAQSTMSSFATDGSITGVEYVIGYQSATPGGERKFLLSDLRGYMDDVSQPANANLTTYAGIAPSVNIQSILAAADYAAVRALLDLEVGTDVQAVMSGGTNGIDLSGSTINLDLTEIFGSQTFGDASTDTIVWTWDRATGTDPTLTFGSAAITLNGTFNATTFVGALSGNATTATTATTANAGDSATAFFSAGTIEHERGGLEADVSAYGGIVGISGGATLNVDTLAEFDTAIGITGTPSSSTFWRGDNTWGSPTVDIDALTEATEADLALTDNWYVSDGGTEKKISGTNFQNFWESQNWTFGAVTIDFSAATSTFGDVVTGNFYLEGATANDFELSFSATDPTADRTITFRDASGTALISGDTLTGEVTATFDTDGSTATTIADSVSVATWTMTGSPGLTLSNGATSAGVLSILEDTDDGTNYTRFTVGAQAGDITYTLPTDDGDSGEFLQTDGAGVLSWVAAAGSGDVTAASAFATDNVLIRADGAGKGVQAVSQIAVDDAGGFVSSLTLAGNPALASDSLSFASNGIIFEGSSANTAETLLGVVNPTGDRTINLPDASGTVILSGHTFTGDVTATIDTDGSTALTIADSVSVATWTVTGAPGLTLSNGTTSAGSIAFVEDGDNGTNAVTLIGPASTADATVTLPSSTGTLLLTDGSGASLTGLTNLATTAGSATLSSGQVNINTTNLQAGIHNGTREVAIPLIQHKTWSFDPDAVCDGAVDRLFLMSTGASEPFGITVVAWKVSFEADPTTEVDLDLKRADAFIGVANSAVMDVLDTTNGASSESTAANINGGAAVANGKVLYLEFGTAYTETTHQIIFEMWYEIEED